MTIAGLGALFGWSRPQVRHFLSRGMPYISRPATRGREWALNTADCLAWARENLPVFDYRAEQARLAMARAELVELQTARMRESFLPRSEVETGWRNAVARAREVLGRLPGEAAGEVARLVDETPDDRQAQRRVREHLRDRIDAALTELAAMPLDEEE